MRISVLCIVFGLGLLSCGDSKPVGRCQIAPLFYCVEYVGSSYTKDLAQTDCETPGGEFTANASCPTDSLVGTCVSEPGTKAEMRTYFYSPQTLEDSRTTCAAMSGTTEFHEP